MEYQTNITISENETDKEDEPEDIYQECYQNLLDAKDNDYLLPSPINLDISKSTKITFPKLIWKGYELVPTKMKVTNSGRTVILSAKWPGDFPYLTGGPLGKNKYLFSDVHFHWGKTAMEGSDHLIEGNQCALEMHVMHTKINYHSHHEAVRKDDAVVMLVYLFDVRFHHNPILQKILLNLENIRQAGSDFHLQPFEINKLVIPFGGDYYAYWGSITSKEDVHPLLWIICRQLNSCSMAQLQLFHHLFDPSLRIISRNWRPIQSDEKRTLFYVNPISPNCSQTMNPKPIMYLESLHNTSNASMQFNQKIMRGTKNLSITVEYPSQNKKQLYI